MKTTPKESEARKFVRKIAKLSWEEMRDLPITQLVGYRDESRRIRKKWGKG